MWIRRVRRVAAAAIALALLGIGAGCAGLLHGTPPPDLGVRDGRLKAPSERPNSVSSQAALWPDHPRSRDAAIAPLALPAGATPAEALQRVQAIVQAMPGARVVEQRPDYLYAVYESRLMRYHDDVEFWFDPAAGVIQVRSASRVGYSDRGVNRARIEAIRDKLRS